MDGAAGWTKELINMLEICPQIKMVKHNATVMEPIIYETEQQSKEPGKIMCSLVRQTSCINFM